LSSHFVTATVESVLPLTENVFRVMLLPHAAPAFAAGQYLQICLTEQLRRPFSIASAPGSRTLELQIGASVRDSRAMEVIHYLQVNRQVTLEMPLGSAHWRDGERPVLVVAGGTGFSYAQSLIDYGLQHAPQRPVTLFWGGRHRQALYARAKVEQWAAAYPQFSHHFVIENGDADWPGMVGQVHQAVVAQVADLAAHDVYVAGPFEMAAAVRTAFFAAGLPPQHLFGDAYAFI